MISYNNSEVVQCLRQYEMFSNSLKLIRNETEREMIIKQLTKLENKIINLTNELYEEEYYTLTNKECSLLEEEKNRIMMLIDLINQRISYVEKRCNDYYQLTGKSIDAPNVIGIDKLDELEDKIKIIDKYSKNIKLEKELKEDVKSLNSKISLASEKIEINNSLNVELELALKKVLSSAFEKLNLYDLLDSKEMIEKTYEETEGSLNLAKSNLERARLIKPELIADCENMLNSINEDYLTYKDEINIIKLIEIYNIDVDDYEQLLIKRKEINEIIKNIKNNNLLNIIMDTISKQYNTIIMEQQDVNTLNDLIMEKERKLQTLSDIEAENDSDAFQSVLKVLIENEKKIQEKILDEQRKIEETEKKKKLEIERKRQEEILKRQRIIEEARKKEIEKRTKKMLEEQQNSILQPKKKEEKIDFEAIKDISDNVKDNESMTPKENLNVTKNKNEIEQELFDEFQNNIKEPIKETDLFNKIDETINDNKLPDISIDEYMKNFDDTKIENTNSLFEETDFPSIPM